MRDKLLGIFILLLALAGGYYGYRALFPYRDVIADGLPGGITYTFDPAGFGEPVVHPCIDTLGELVLETYGINKNITHQLNSVSFQLTLYENGRFVNDVIYYVRRTPDNGREMRMEMSNRQFGANLDFRQRLIYLEYLYVTSFSEKSAWDGKPTGGSPARGVEDELEFQWECFDNSTDIYILSRWDGEGEIVSFAEGGEGRDFIECVRVYHNIQINPDLPDELFSRPFSSG